MSECDVCKIIISNEVFFHKHYKNTDLGKLSATIRKKNEKLNNIVKVAFMISILLISFPTQAVFAVNTLQDGMWDFDFAGLILSDTKFVKGNQLDIIVPIYNTGTEAGSVLVTSMITGPNAEKYYGEIKVFDIIPNLQNNNFAKFSFIPINSGTYSIDTAIQTPDAAHIFDSSKQSFVVKIYDIEADIPEINSVDILPVESTIQQAPVVIESVLEPTVKQIADIPKDLSVEAYIEPEIVYDTSNQVDSNELSQLKIDIQELKKSINIFEILLIVIIIITVVSLGIIFPSKKRRSIKNSMKYIYNYYKKPVTGI